MVDPPLILGTSGMLLLLAAFVLNMMKRTVQDSHSYLALNIVGGGLLTYYAYTLNSLPFLVLEGIWTAFALYKMLSNGRWSKVSI